MDLFQPLLRYLSEGEESADEEAEESSDDE
jgi:hypothetical protein